MRCGAVIYSIYSIDLAAEDWFSAALFLSQQWRDVVRVSGVKDCTIGNFQCAADFVNIHAGGNTKTENFIPSRICFYAFMPHFHFPDSFLQGKSFLKQSSIP